MTASRPAEYTKNTPTLAQTSQPVEEKDGFKLVNLWVVIRRRRLWFAATFGLVLSTVGVLTMTEWVTRPQYRGGFRMLVKDPLAEERQRASGDLDSLARVNNLVNVPNLIEVLASPMLLDPLAKQLGLTQGSLQGIVSIKRSGRESDVLDVNVLWNNPEQGKNIVDALAKEYLDYSLRQRREKLNQGLEFLDEQAPGLQQRVTNLQQELATFRRVNTMLAPEEQSRALEQSRASLEGELRTLKQNEAQLLSLMNLVRDGQLVSPFQGTSMPIPGDGGAAANIERNFSTLLSELVDIEGELSKAQATYSANSPLVRNLRARRDRLRPLLQRREMEAIAAALQVNRVQQGKVNDQISALGAEFRKNPELIKGYEALQQRLNVARENLGSYLEARENFRLEVAQSTVPWRIISPPYFGSTPVEPNIQKRLLQGLLIGLAAGSAVAYLRDQLDHGFHSKRGVEEFLGIPVIASIPYLQVIDKRPIKTWQKDLSREEWFELRESLRNFYQALRRLQFNRKLRTLAITSSQAGEGKSTVIALLAQSIVDMGKKVLLVDADLRRPQLHNYLDIDGKKGLGDMFNDKSLLVQDLLQWPEPDLAFLPGGQEQADAAKLLSSERFTEIMKEIRNQEQFDLILFDTPPGLKLVDPILIGEKIDGIILLVSMGAVNRELPREVLRRTRESGINVIGALTNEQSEMFTGYERHYILYSSPEYSNSSTDSPKFVESEGIASKSKKMILDTKEWLDGR